MTRAVPVVAWPSATVTYDEDDTPSLQITPPAANDMTGTLAYAAGASNPASLTDDVGSGRSTGFAMSAGDAHLSTIEIPLVDDALNEENETFTVTVEAGTGYTVGSPATMTVTIADNDPPAVPGSLVVVAGGGVLTARWSKPDGPVAGYQARWKETAAPDSDATGDGTDPSTGWVAGGAVPSPSTSQTITGLTNGTGYDVQVRATDGQTAAGNGYGPWSATKSGTPEAPPRSATVLVSNLGQSRFQQVATTNGRVYAQGFTTGSNAGGYTLSSIAAVINAGARANEERAAIRAELWSAAAGGGPASMAAELTVPPTVEAGTVSFEAPANTWLPANTTYFVVLYTTTGFNMQLSLVNSAAEDSDSQPGWSILDIVHVQTGNLPGAGWRSGLVAVLAIRVNGAALPVVVPAAPPGLGVTPGAAMLDLSWTAPVGVVTGYDVHYTSSTTVGNDAAVQMGASPSAADGWVDAGHTGVTASQTITGLTNDTAYRVRVRAKNGAGDGAWAFGSGTPKATTTGSTDATLKALALSAGTLRPAFSATTYVYAAEVPVTGATVTVTPTVSESNATVTVNGTSVTSGSASGAIALDFGTNRIMVEVTAQEGNTQRYTIAVHRALPAVSWAAITATVCPGVSQRQPACREGDTATLGLNADVANAMSGTVTYAAGAAHPASPSDDLGSARSTTFTMTADEDAPTAIEVPIVDDAVNEEHETFTVTIGPGTGYAVGSPATQTITIRDNDPPAAPGSLALTAGDTKLDVAWAKPPGPVTRYRLRWKETSAPDRPETTLGDPSTGWVTGGGVSSPSLSASITGLTNDTSYDVQVQADDGQTGAGSGWGAWSATKSETPTRPVSDLPRNVRATAGDAKLTLTWQAPSSWGTRTGRDYRIEWKLSSGGASDWSAATGGGTLQPSVTSYEFSGTQTDANGSSHTVANGTSYDLRIRASSLKPGTDGTDPSHIEYSAWVPVLDQVPSVPSQGAVLVSNLGQLRFASRATTANVVNAQGFTTGSNAGGYALSGIAAEVNSATSRNDELTAIRAELWSAATGGGPEAMETELTVPPTIAAGIVSFEAPANTWLAANTTYFFVVYTTTNYDMRLHAVSSTDEDSDSQAGWGILDIAHFQSRNLPVGSWSSSTVPLAIRVNGATVQVAVPAAPPGLGVTPGAAKLDLSWAAPLGVVTGYDVHYTSSTTVAANAAVQTGGSPSAADGWVDAGHTDATTTQTISGLTNDTPYRVRVRGVNGAGDGAWAFGSGTPKATATGSTDATLKTLALSAGTLRPAFSATTYAYAADVAATATTVTVTPEVNESNATVTVNGTSVASGEASGEIALGFGSNTITVEVTAQAGNTQSYTIAVHRTLPTVEWATATAVCPVEGLAIGDCYEGDTPTLSLNADVANAMSGTVTYAAGATHPASLSDDVGSGRTTTFTMVEGDTLPSAIEVPLVDDAVNEEHETFTVTIEEGTGYTVGSQATITVTITDNDPPAVPGGLMLAPDDGKLTASWQRPDGPVAGYRMRWRETGAPDSGTGVDPSTGWVVGEPVSSPSLSASITGLTNGTSYDVQVRADDGQGGAGVGLSPWTATKSETPRPKTYGFAAESASAPPGTIDLKVVLSVPAPADDLALTVTRLLGTAVPEDVCTGTLATAEDIGSNPPTSATVKAGLDTVTVRYPLADNGDDLVGGGECFALRLGTDVTGWNAADNEVVKVTISRQSGKIAFGGDAASTAKHTASVAENVDGGTLSVPMTVDYLPNASTTFTVAVLTGGSATEGTDFSIATKTVTFAPGDAGKMQNLTVTITDDLEIEDDETIELGIVAAPNNDATLNSSYARDANGRLAAVTIESEDAVPAAVTGLTVEPGNTKLDLDWTAPADTGSAAVSGYDVHYTSAPGTGTGAVLNDAPASGSDASAAWVAVSRTGTEVSQEIAGLDNDQEYRVRVRAANAVGGGPWVHRTGTPERGPSYEFGPAEYTGAPGATIRPTVVLSEAAPAGGLALTVTQLLGASVPTGLCGDVALATAADIGASPPTSATVAAGQTEVQFDYTFADNGDDLVGGGECFGLQLGTSVTGWTAGDSPVAKVTIEQESGKIAFGGDAASTAKHTASVKENVDDGTLSVPVTVDYLPSESTTFTIAVLTGGSATEDTDFSISTKTVTFAPGDATKTQNLAVTITDDAAIEDDETIELGIVAAPSDDATLNSDYERDANGRLAQVTIESEDAAAAAVTGLKVVASNTRLDLSWTAPADTGSAAVTGYDVHYTSAPETGAGAVLDDAPASGNDASAAWVAVTRTGTTASQGITGLTNDDEYRVRVRAVNAVGGGPWVRGTGTPALKAYGFSAASVTGAPGTSAQLDIALSEAAPSGGLALTVTQLLGTSVPTGVCDGETLAVAADIGQNPPTSVTVTAGAATASIRYPLADNGDDLVGGGECFAVQLGTSVAGWSAGTGVAKVTVSRHSGKIAFGDDAAAMAKHTASVAENVDGGTLSVPVTVDHLPAGETVFTVTVGTTGTATEGTDFTIATKTVTFGPSTQKMQNLAVTITNDAAVEANETIELGIAAAAGGDTSPNSLYTRHAQGSLATVTITSEDALPAAVTGLGVTADNTKLDLSWTAPADTGSAALSGYDVHYTSAPGTGNGAVLDDAPASGNDASAAWVAVSRTGTTTTQAITGLDNDQEYRVRVRAVNAVGGGPWVRRTGTPDAKTYGFSQVGYETTPGTSVLADIALSDAAPSGGLALTITQLLGASVPTGVCGDVALATAADIGANPPTSVTVSGGTTTASITYPIADNGDDLVGGGECFAVRLGTSTTGWTAGDAVVPVTIRRASGLIAMGSDAAATAKYAAAVAETVTGGTLSVPVTVDHLPNESTTFTIAVLTGGTATEDTDFSIATKTVTFAPGDAGKMQNLTVTITNDAAVEGSETIELGIAAAAQNDETLNPDYTRDANGRLATITITSEDAVPAEVTGLNVAPGNARLDLSWTAPADTGSAAVSGYDVHYTSAPGTGNGAVLDDAPASGNDASAAWVAVSRTGTTTTQAITGLTNDTPYRVRVRAVNAVGGGPWVHRTRTPALKTYGFSAGGYDTSPGTSVLADIVLSEAAPAGGLALTITQLLGTSVPTGVCGDVALATATDIGANPPTSVTVSAGATTASINYPIADNGDDLVGGGECFAVQLGTSVSGWSAGDAVVPVTIRRSSGRIAMGSSAGATAKYRATVPETVTGGTLSVPVTVDYLPSSSTTFAVEVLSGGTATENADFSIATKSVTFGPTTQKKQNVAVTITNDAAVEGSETIELGIVAAAQNDETLNPDYTRDANGRLAQITITSEDAVPGAVTNLDVAADSAKLDLTWTAPASTGSSAITGYDVHYTSATASAVPNGDPASGSDPAAGWVAVTRSGTTASQSITGLTNDQAHRVRVRAVNTSGGGAWEFGAGTPAAGPSSNANLSGLSATWSSGSGYASLALHEPFAEGTTAYTATAPNATTHVKVRPTAAHTAASVTVNGTTVASGQESAAIALGTTGSTIAIRVTAEDATTKDYSVAVARRSAVTLAASPNPVPEGSDVTVTATLSAALGADVEIPLRYTTSTAEVGDFHGPRSITITAGATTGTGTITTARDDGQNDEVFTVSLGANLPSSVEAGTPSSVEVRIADVPAVSLEAPGEVEEGESVTVTARLSRAIGRAVMIPVTTTRGTSEPDDHGTLLGILIASGATSGEGTISTREDDDLDDETFTVTVRAEALPSPLVAGDPTSVEVRIVDIDTLSITLTSSTLRPSEGSTARLTATLSHPAPEGGVTLQFTADGAGDNPAAPITDYTLDPAGEAQNATAPIEIAEGQRTAHATLRVVNDTEPEDDEGIQVGIATETVLEKWPEPLDLTIPANDGGGGTSAVAWLDAVPNPVVEGREVEIDVWLSDALDADATIPLTVTRGTSEEGDHGTLDQVVVAAGATRGTGTISTERDDDADDETFTVRLGSPLPTGVRAGTPSRIEVVIADRDKPRVRLEVDPDVVPEGDPVTVTALLTAPLARAVTIPVETVRGTSESGDHGTLRSIRIASGDTEGTGRITTRADSDTDDETFSVVLGDDLPDGVSAGFPDSVEITITDETPTDDADVSLTAEPLEVPEGESVTVTATLDKALARTVTIPVTVRRGTSESGDHGSLSGIRIASGETEGTGTITTSVDTDTDDETFSVVLRASQPSGVSVGYPDSVEITITDRGGDAPGRVRNLRVTAGDNKLDLTWSPPSSGTVDVYQGEYKERSASEWTAIHESGGNYADTEATVQGANGTTYDVRIRGSNEYGVGPWATGSGTPTAGSGGSSDLRSLSVRVSATEDGSYRSVSLSPSFRSSVTSYKATAPTGTKYAKFRPASRTTVDLILVAGHEVASGAESPAVAVHDGVPVWIAVLPTGDGQPKEYSVTFTIPAASGDAVGGSVTAAVDAALAAVGELSPEHAAGALLGERSLMKERLEALDRLGNANGRYDVGDLLAWIERCRAGGAQCGEAPRPSPPASDAALPGAAGAVGAAAKRPRRRSPGRKRPKRRRLRGLAVLLAAALWSCDGVDLVGPPSAADVPEPGTLAVAWTATAGGPAAAGALVEIDGPRVGDAHAHGGLELYAAEETNGPRRFVLAGDMRNGAVLEFEVPDRRQAGLYSVRIVEVAGADHRLLEPDGYRTAIASN